jgi:hypothetical protein
MANVFNNAVANNIGTTDTVIYTAPTGIKAILIGCNLANLTEGTLPVSLILRKSAGDTYIVRNKRVRNGESEELMKGNKLIMLPGDSLVAVTVEDNAFDAIASILTGVT